MRVMTVVVPFLASMVPAPMMATMMPAVMVRSLLQGLTNGPHRPAVSSSPRCGRDCPIISDTRVRRRQTVALRFAGYLCQLAQDDDYAEQDENAYR